MDTKLAYAQMLIDKGGGICCCGGHLGVFVSKKKFIVGTPVGWVFVDVDDVAAEQLVEIIAFAAQGRSLWPTKEVPGKPDQHPK